MAATMEDSMDDPELAELLAMDTFGTTPRSARTQSKIMTGKASDRKRKRSADSNSNTNVGDGHGGAQTPAEDTSKSKVDAKMDLTDLTRLVWLRTDVGNGAWQGGKIFWPARIFDEEEHVALDKATIQEMYGEDAKLNRDFLAMWLHKGPWHATTVPVELVMEAESARSSIRPEADVVHASSSNAVVGCAAAFKPSKDRKILPFTRESVDEFRPPKQKKVFGNSKKFSTWASREYGTATALALAMLEIGEEHETKSRTAAQAEEARQKGENLGEVRERMARDIQQRAEMERAAAPEDGFDFAGHPEELRVGLYLEYRNPPHSDVELQVTKIQSQPEPRVWLG